jgi:S-adenosyl-L-methionine hydrolase (adenosine-forming)
MARPVITFATDFGPAAPAVCRGVMFQIAPDANIIDISHSIPRYSIRDGAGTLVFALPHMPVGVHVAVVDPGVGTDRLAIAIRSGRGDFLIGPDNGLLVGAAELLGGIVEVRSIENRDLMLPVVTSSFHGRDIFAPVAAHLATGTPFDSVGPVVPIDRLVRIVQPVATVRDGGLDTSITDILIFGNVTFAGTPADLEAAIGPVAPGRRLAVEFPAVDGQAAVREETIWAETFGAVPLGHSLLMSDSEGRLSLADNQGNAAWRLGLNVDRPARIVSA